MAYNSNGFRVSVMPQTNFLDPRLLAPNANLLQNFQQGVGAAGQLGSLADMITARNRVAATQADAIAAENARNKLVAAGSLADLSQLPQKSLVAGRRLQLEGGQLTGQLGNLQTQQELDAATLQAAAAEAERKKAVLAQTTEPRTNTDVLNADLALGNAQTATATQDANSQAAINDANAKALESQLNLNKQKSVSDFIAQNPDAPVKDLQAHINKIDAENARALAQTKAGGMTPSEVTAQENQTRLNELNAGQLEVAKQNAATNAAKIAAAANDPLKLAKVHLEMGKTVLSNGQTVEQALGNFGGAETPYFHSNLNPSDKAIVNSYAQLSARLAQGAIAPQTPPGPYSAFEGKILNGPNGAKVRIVNGNPVPVK